MKRCPKCSVPCWDSHQFCPGCGSDLQATVPTQEDRYIGVTLGGKYRLLELIGEGSMGRVYRAKHLALEVDVAVKLLNAELAMDKQTVRRFHQEARSASRLRHPNIISTL